MFHMYAIWNQTVGLLIKIKTHHILYTACGKQSVLSPLLPPIFLKFQHWTFELNKHNDEYNKIKMYILHITFQFLFSLSQIHSNKLPSTRSQTALNSSQGLCHTFFRVSNKCIMVNCVYSLITDMMNAAQVALDRTTKMSVTLRNAYQRICH